MIKESAIVVGIQGQLAQVQMQRQSACSHCDLNQGCGTGAIGRLLGHRSMPVNIENALNLKPGDHILLGMPDRGFLQASLLIYGLPLGLLVIASVMMHWLANGSEGLVLIAACAGFVSGLIVSAKLAGKRLSAQLKPQILQINSEPIDSV